MVSQYFVAMAILDILFQFTAGERAGRAGYGKET